MVALGVKSLDRRVGSVFSQMRVLPLARWNIWNINYFIKNIYKKHRDNDQLTYHPHRNTLEQSGTTFLWLFRQCSTQPFRMKTAETLIEQGLQPNTRKIMFRLVPATDFRH